MRLPASAGTPRCFRRHVSSEGFGPALGLWRKSRPSPRKIQTGCKLRRLSPPEGSAVGRGVSKLGEIVMRKTFGAPVLFLAGLLAPPLAPALTAQQSTGLKQELLTVQV